AGVGAGAAGGLAQLVGDLLHEPRDVGPYELPVGPVIAAHAGHPRFRQRVDPAGPAEPVVQRLRLRRHLLPPASLVRPLPCFRLESRTGSRRNPPRTPLKVTGYVPTLRVSDERAGPPQPNPDTDALRALALSPSTATRAYAGGMQGVCRWYGDLPRRPAPHRPCLTGGRPLGSGLPTVILVIGTLGLRSPGGSAW